MHFVPAKDTAMRTYIAFVAPILLLLACGHSDPKLNGRIENRLAAAGVPTEQVRVSSEDRIVRIEGLVATGGERDRVELIVRNVPGVLAVDNRLTVQAPVHVTGATTEK